MDPSREAEPLADAFLAAYRRRKIRAEVYNAQLLSEIRPSLRQRFGWHLRAALGHAAATNDPASGSSSGLRSDRSLRYQTYENEWRQKSGQRHASIIWALNDVLTGFWAAGLFKIFGDMCQLMVPLVTKQLILYAQRGERRDRCFEILTLNLNTVHDAHRSGKAEPNIGPGIGMALGVFLLTILASLGTHQVSRSSHGIHLVTDIPRLLVLLQIYVGRCDGQSYLDKRHIQASR